MMNQQTKADRIDLIFQKPLWPLLLLSLQFADCVTLLETTPIYALQTCIVHHASAMMQECRIMPDCNAVPKSCDPRLMTHESVVMENSEVK